MSLPLAVLLALPLPRPARAGGDYEVQVYASETAPPGTTMVELHSNAAPRGAPDGSTPSPRAFQETLEVTRGFNDWFETGFYVFTSARDGEGWAWAGDTIRPRVRVPPAWGWPVGVSLSAEVGWMRREFSESSWGMEIRPIVDLRRGRLYLSFNPNFERSLGLYEGGSRDFVFAPAAKASLDLTETAAAGVEYYGGGGRGQLFAVLDLGLGPGWEFDAGAGFGLTRSTEDLVLKLILGRRFGPAG